MCILHGFVLALHMNQDFISLQIAGAAAAAGRPLHEVTSVANHAASVVGTMGVALSVCTLPGQVTSDRLGPGKMELGLGIVSFRYFWILPIILILHIFRHF